MTKLQSLIQSHHPKKLSAPQLICVDWQIMVTDMRVESKVSVSALETMLLSWGYSKVSVLDRLHQYEAGGNRFFDCILTGDETWCHYSEPESKWQLMEWHHSCSSEKKKFKMQTSGDKMMCTVFWNMKGIILLGFLELSITLKRRQNWRPGLTG